MASFIPITLAPSSEFDIPLEDGDFLITVRWMGISGSWVIDIEKEGVVLIDGLRLVLGTDLVSQFNFGIGIWVMLDLTNTGEDATRNNLGTNIKLLYIPESERDTVNV
jgi:hypothetical protein